MNKKVNSKMLTGVKIGLVAPSEIRDWSSGEVKKPETINYRTYKPEKDGLFCERIFGPEKDWRCSCGKYKKIRYKGVVCENCGVEVTKSSVRRERMGHVELAAPVSHIWFFKGIPSKMGLVLNMSPKKLEKVLYFACYIVLDPKDTGLRYKQVLTEREYNEAIEKYGINAFRVGMGAESIKEVLSKLDLNEEFKEIKKEFKDATGQKKRKLLKRLGVIDSFRKSDNKPEWMILDVLPVIPPDLRPLIQLDGGRFAASDLNNLYRRVINRNNRLKKLLDIGAPSIMIKNEKRMLQESVDSLIDNGRRGRAVTGPGRRPLKSLTEMLKGKGGRFRQNLLGKRVDYSGRSVIVVGPDLKFWQCGLPKEMAIELFKPFVIRKLIEKEYATNIKAAKKMMDRQDERIWDVLEKVIKNHPVMLNRAPSLHRLSIQAFEPVLVEGKAIKLHPLACGAFNADFDGDQMAVHVPLSLEAQAECRYLMLSTNNLLRPSDGKPIAVPSQDMILGLYYLSLEKDGEKGEGKVFKDENEVLMAYDKKEISLHAKIKVRRTLEFDGKKESKIVDITPGKVIVNQGIPQDLGFVDRSKEEKKFEYEITQLLHKGAIKEVIAKCIEKHENPTVVEMSDFLKDVGYKYSTVAGFTFAVSDLHVPKEKEKILQEAEENVQKFEKLYKRGLITDAERYKKVIRIWTDATEDVKNALLSGMDRLNPIQVMAHSGARGSDNQIKQLAGMRGNMADTTGKTIELPIKASFKEGLNVLEYFISSHGARKGLSDTALRTADSGYLTRRLVDAAQDIIAKEEDCAPDGEIPGAWVEPIIFGKEVIESISERIKGRVAGKDIINPKNDEVIIKANEMIDKNVAEKVEMLGIEKVFIRTALTCETEGGICTKCYGLNMGRGGLVKKGESVGIVAAQSIGEPGTQLTMRTFHTGGIAGGDGGDITQGLPRVEEIFEARKPKGKAILTEIPGTVEIKVSGKKREAIIIDEETKESKKYLIPFQSKLEDGIKDGAKVEKGQKLTKGSANPHDILEIKGVKATEEYIIKEVQKVYKLQGVEIGDKHIEIILKQMLKRIKVISAGDTDLIPGNMIDYTKFKKANKKLAKGKKKATGKRVLLGLTKTSLARASFLSAASFQQTKRVLTDAALQGQVDKLKGIKENVIIGNFIPAGTGLSDVSDIEVSFKEE